MKNIYSNAIFNFLFLESMSLFSWNRPVVVEYPDWNLLNLFTDHQILKKNYPYLANKFF